MARDIFVNGETMVLVKGPADSPTLSATQQLGLADGGIRVRLNSNHLDVNADAWGRAPFEIQYLLSDVTITMPLVHFDRTFLDECLRLSMGGGQGAVGRTSRAGRRMGGNVPQFAVGNSFIGLILSSPVGEKPWRFWYTYLAGSPMEFPLGNERSVVQLTWRAVPYTNDPWGGGSAQPSTVAGAGADEAIIWDHASATW